jgi:pyruvate formate lyase activating enzyme
MLRVRELPLEKFVAAVRKSATIGVAYTYSEPTIWFETIMDAGSRVRELGLKNVMVTNGFVEEKPLQDLLAVVDAMNIDIKSMNPSFYRRICKGPLAPVLRTCETAKKAGCHVEITNLLIPGENDAPEETAELARFIAGHLGADTPLHISRYFPRHKMRHGPTPASSIEEAWEIAKERLEYVYAGNIATDGKEHTNCPQCGTLLVSRYGYSVHPTLSLTRDQAGKSGRCAKCGRSINILI